MQKNTKVFLIILSIALLGFGTLLISAVQDSAAYYHTIEEIKLTPPLERTLRVKGALISESISYNPQGPLLEFSITDGDYVLEVISHQAAPDNFLHSDEVIVEGKLMDNGVFKVSKLMLQCPSKYESEDEGV